MSLVWSESWLKGGVREKRKNLRKAWGRKLGWRFIKHEVLDGVMAGYCVSLPFDVKHMFLNLSARLGLREASPTRALRMCRIIAKDAFKYGSRLFGKLWRYLVDLDMLFGSSVQGGSTEEIRADMTHWVGRDSKWKGSKLRQVFRDGFAQVSNKMKLASRSLTTKIRAYDEFHMCPSEWVASGSSTVEGIEDLRRSKVASYLRWASEIPGYLSTGLQPWEEDPYLVKVLEKRERKKVRGTAMASWTSFVDQAFCCQGIERIVGEALRTNIGCKDETSFWNELIHDSQTSLGLPIDISAFDHGPPDWMVIECVQLLLDVCWDGSEEMLMSGKRVIDQIRNSVLEHEGHSVKWEGGVLSGWRITSVIDTVINASIAYGTGVTMAAVPATTGDDALFFVNSRDDMERIISVYEQVVSVNRRKFFNDGVRSEFLRYLMVRGVKARVGYPARFWSGYCFTQAFTEGCVEDCFEIVSAYQMGVNRGMRKHEMHRQCVERLADHFDCPRWEASAFLHTPASFGGGGESPFCETWRKSRRSVDVISVNGKSRRVLGWDLLSGMAKKQLGECRNKLGVPHDYLKGIYDGLRPKKSSTLDSSKQYLEKVKPVARGPVFPSAERESVRRPDWSIDAWFRSSWIRSRPREWAHCVDVFDVDRLRSLESRIGRGRFIDWLLSDDGIVKVRSADFGMLDSRDSMKKITNWLPRWSGRKGGSEWWGRILSTEIVIKGKLNGRLLD